MLFGGNSPRHILTLLFVLSAIACQKTTPASHDETLKNVSSTNQTSGTLVDDILKNQASDWARDCDIKFKDQELEMARALESRATEIQDHATHPVESSDYDILNYGELFLRQPKIRPYPMDEWEYRVQSWDRAYKFFLAIKDNPQESDWADLNTVVRSLVLNDKIRLVEYVNMQLDESSKPFLEKARVAVQKCVNDDHCTSPELDGDLKTFFEGNDILNGYLKRMAKAQSLNDKHLEIAHLDTRLRADYADVFGFDTNHSAVRLDGKTLELPLNAGALESIRPQLTDFIEMPWRSSNLHLKVKWVNEKDSQSVNAYRFVLNPTFGQRAITSRNRRTVTVSNGVIITTFGHEIGHVLGFQDHYYYLWQSDSCEYKDELNHGDIMSDGLSGKVTPAEWEELDKRYPL